jgi:hypothetical protein
MMATVGSPYYICKTHTHKPERMRLLYLIIFTSLLLPSCLGTKEDELKAKLQQRQETKARIQKENQNALLGLVEQNDAWVGWDTTNLYTFVLQEELIDDSLLIAFPGYVNDIFKKDSSYYLDIGHSFLLPTFSKKRNRDYKALILVEPGLFDRFRDSIDKEEFTNDGMFIVQVQSITPYTPELKHEIDYNGYGQKSTLTLISAWITPILFSFSDAGCSISVC